MKRLILVLAVLALLPGILAAGKKKRSALRVNASNCTIHEGASDNSKVAGTADEDEELELRDENLHNGFYKVEYQGKICFVKAGKVSRFERDDDDEEDDDDGKDKDSKATPTKKVSPTKAPTKVPTKAPTKTAIPTKIPTKAATEKPTLEPTEEPTEAPTEKPTKVPTAVPTLEPTEVPTEEPTEVPTEKPTRVPTAIPTPEPTEAPTEIPTEKPTRVPTAVPTAVPTPEPTPEPTKVPTARPTAVPPTTVPTPKPTLEPTKAPTARPTIAYVAPTATPQPQGPQPVVRRAQGKAIQKKQAIGGTGSGSVQFNTTYRQNGSGAGSAGSSLPSRQPGQPLRGQVWLGLGWGKPYEVKPAFKPTLSESDIRNIGSSVFFGLGGEGRVYPWLRFFGDWTAHSHSTLAADAFALAPAVDVPGLSSLLSDTDVQYRMTTQGFRVGFKASLPLGWFEPWVGGGAGIYVWSAQYLDRAETMDYGSDNGLAFGFTGMLGIDFNVELGSMVLVITPFGELGSPVVNPTVKDIAGTGFDWHDSYGTAVMVPRRLGLQVGLGF